MNHREVKIIVDKPVRDYVLWAMELDSLPWIGSKRVIEKVTRFVVCFGENW